MPPERRFVKASVTIHWRDAGAEDGGAKGGVQACAPFRRRPRGAPGLDDGTAVGRGLASCLGWPMILREPFQDEMFPAIAPPVRGGCRWNPQGLTLYETRIDGILGTYTIANRWGRRGTLRKGWDLHRCIR